MLIFFERYKGFYRENLLRFTIEQKGSKRYESTVVVSGAFFIHFLYCYTEQR